MPIWRPIHAEAGNVGHYRLVETGFQLGQFLGDDLFHTGVLQTHRIDHAAGALRDPGGGIAEPGIPGGTLERKSTQLVDVVNFGKLIAEAEGAGGRDHGVIQFNAAEIDFGIYHKISSFFMTGPSLQIRL